MLAHSEQQKHVMALYSIYSNELYTFSTSVRHTLLHDYPKNEKKKKNQHFVPALHSFTFAKSNASCRNKSLHVKIPHHMLRIDIVHEDFLHNAYIVAACLFSQARAHPVVTNSTGTDSLVGPTSPHKFPLLKPLENSYDLSVLFQETYIIPYIQHGNFQQWYQSEKNNNRCHHLWDRT